MTWAEASNNGVLAADVTCLKGAKPAAIGFCNVVPSWFYRLRHHREDRSFHEFQLVEFLQCKNVVARELVPMRARKSGARVTYV